MGAKLSATGEQSAKVTNALKEIGRGLIEEGIATVDNLADKLREYLKEKFEKLDVDSLDINKVVDLIKNDIETGKRIKIPTKMIREFVKRGITDINDLTLAIKDALKDKYPDATEREIRDAITDYGKSVNPSQEEVAVQIRKLKRIGRHISAMEDIQAKKRPLKSGLQRDKLDAEERALQKELREAMKDLPMDEDTEADQLRTQLDAAKQRVKNQIEDLQKEIDAREQVKRDPRVVQKDEELNALIEQRDKLKEEHNKIFKDEAFIEQRKLELSKQRVKNRIQELERKLREGDFSKKVNKPVIADTELIKLRAEQQEIKDKYDKEFYKYELQNRTSWQKNADRAWEAWGLLRGVQATGEFSFVIKFEFKFFFFKPLGSNLWFLIFRKCLNL